MATQRVSGSLCLALLTACGPTTLEIQQDFGADGSINDRSDYAFDGSLRTLDRFDNGADGTWESSVARVFDGDGRLVSVERAQEGQVISGGRFVYAEGSGPYAFFEDVDGDGLTDTEHSFAYDDAGRLRSILTEAGDERTRTTLEWGEAGVESVASDRGDDGTLNRLSSFTYDGTGALIALALDVNGDGVPDSLYGYNIENGRLRERWEDFNADGVPEFTTTYSHGEHGPLRRERFDGDGALVRADAYTYDGPQLTRLDSDWDGDGQLDLITYFEGSCPPCALELLADPMPEARPPSPFDGVY